MGDEKDTWKVKTLDEILQEKKRRKELEEKTDPKRQKTADDREAKRDTPEEGELRDNRMEITIRNSPYVREDSTEDRYGPHGEGVFVYVCVRACVRVRACTRSLFCPADINNAGAGLGCGAFERPPDRRPPSPPPSATRRDRLEQLERQRERERKLREQQQKEQRELKERERRVEERRKEREARREGGLTCCVVFSAVREEKPEDRDLLSDLQDISDSERKTSTAASSSGSGSGSEEEEEEDEEEAEEEDDEEEESSSHSEGEEEESASNSGGSMQSAESVKPKCLILSWFCVRALAVPESRFDHDSEESVDEEEVEDGDVTPQSHSRSATPEENYIPDSPPISPVELKKELPKYLPAFQGCRSVEEFQCLNRIEEGTYGVVYRAKDKKTDEIVALKRLKMEKEKEGFPITSLREINTILKAQHPNIVTVREIVVGSNMDKIYIVMNYVEHDLKSLMETMKQPFLPGEVKTLMIQLLRGVRHLHDNWILHRDLKTSNLLLSHKGILKVGDFGLAREYGSPLKPYTPVVVTLWYRAPELLLGAKEYSTAVDMWSVGCIFGELLTQKPLFPGKSEIDQINKIFKDLGSPSEKIWPGYNELPALKKMSFTEYPYNNLRKRFGALLSDLGFDLMNKFLTYCPSKRISAEEALKHEYFRETPLPIEPSMFPTWPAKSEQQRVKRGTSPKPPEGGLGYSQLGDDDLKETGFHLTTTNQGASAAGPGFSLKF
uniref:cyclin-dependent kinase n=1 Tax=Scleropages formosus TaxID=113540 RepID=A0A8C9TPA1_SCLFO